jgi:hypothetical protein
MLRLIMLLSIVMLRTPACVAPDEPLLYRSTGASTSISKARSDKGLVKSGGNDNDGNDGDDDDDNVQGHASKYGHLDLHGQADASKNTVVALQDSGAPPARAERAALLPTVEARERGQVARPGTGSSSNQSKQTIANHEGSVARDSAVTKAEDPLRIIFIKSFKVASTTVSAILQRIAEERGMKVRKWPAGRPQREGPIAVGHRQESTQERGMQ